MSGIVGHRGILLSAGSGGVYTYWNPLDKATDAVLSSSNQVVGGTSGSTKWVRSVLGKSTGKWRVQFVDVVHADTVGFGFATGSSIGSFLGATSAGWAMFANYGSVVRLYNNGSYTTFSVTLATNDTVDLLLDIPGGKAWWRKNGVAISGDPAAGTGPMATFTPGATIYIAADPFGANGAVRLRTNPNHFVGAPVSGFTDGWF